MFMYNFRTNILKAVQMVWEYSVFHFLGFLQADYRIHLAYMLVS